MHARWMSNTFGSVGAIVLFGGIAGAVPSSANEAAKVRGARLYQRACATCHGASGDGQGPSSRYVSPRPRDFRNGVYKFRSTPTGKPPTIDDLTRTIRTGVPRTEMPAWRTLLGEQEIEDVAHFLTTFAPGKFARPAESLEIPERPEPTPARLAEGKSLYIMLSCWTCHGTRGRGGGKTAGSLTDDWGRPIEAFDFTTGRFKSGQRDEDIYRTISTGLDGTPMPSFAQAVLVRGASERMLDRYRKDFSAEEISALEAYLATQPSREAFKTLTDEEKTRLARRRVWSLVHYVRSLRRERGIVHDLFVEDHEVTW